MNDGDNNRRKNSPYEQRRWHGHRWATIQHDVEYEIMKSGCIQRYEYGLAHPFPCIINLSYLTIEGALLTTGNQPEKNYFTNSTVMPKMNVLRFSDTVGLF